MAASRLTKISIMTALTIIGAYITIPLPNLPFTLQTFFCILSGLLLSRRDAAISQLLYIAIGLIGLPVFVGGGGGIAYALSPTFGYILSLPVVAYMVSLIKERNVYIAVFMPSILLLVIGGIWLILVTKMYVGADIKRIILTIFIIYIPIEMAKGFLGILIWRRLKNII